MTTSYFPATAFGGDILARVYLLGDALPGTRASEQIALSWDYELIPAPSVLALLGLSGLIATRRRRAQAV